MGTRGRRIAFVSSAHALECREVQVPDPRPGEIVVRTLLAGVCGTDAHRIGGDMEPPTRPIALGHEGVGRIHLLGKGVQSDLAGVPVSVGDLVYWIPMAAHPGANPLGAWPPPADEPSPAAYQDYATLPAGNVVYRIPDTVSAESVIAFGCAMPTAIGAMARLGGIRAGQSVVVQGCGPVGLAATVLASLSPARQVIVIGDPADRLDAALRLGATAVLPLESTTVAERRDSVLAHTEGRGADVVVEAAGRMVAFEEGMGLLAPGGRYLVVGIYSGKGNVTLDPVRLNNLNLSVIGSLGPTQPEDVRTTIHLAERHGHRLGFEGLITNRFSLLETAEAIAVAGAGTAIKAVVVP